MSVPTHTKRVIFQSINNVAQFMSLPMSGPYIDRIDMMSDVYIVILLVYFSATMIPRYSSDGCESHINSF